MLSSLINLNFYVLNYVYEYWYVQYLEIWWAQAREVLSPRRPKHYTKNLTLQSCNGHFYKQSLKGQKKYIPRNFILQRHLHVFDFVTVHASIIRDLGEFHEYSKLVKYSKD